MYVNRSGRIPAEYSPRDRFNIRVINHNFFFSEEKVAAGYFFIISAYFEREKFICLKEVLINYENKKAINQGKKNKLPFTKHHY